MKKLKLPFFLIIIAICLILVGFYRDFVFVNINALLQAWDYNTIYTMPPSLQFFVRYKYNTVLNTKWFLTLLFSIIYLLIAMGAINLLFKKKRYIRIAVLVYVAIIFVSALFILIGFVWGGASETMYEFARYLMGMAQSPIVLMILIPAFKLSNENLMKE